MPPIWLLISLIAMTALHYLMPVRTIVPPPLHWGGAVLIVGGVMLVGGPARMFSRAKTTIVPFNESSALVTSGPYRFTRNPIYVGMTSVLAGFAILFGSLTPWLVVPMFVLLIDRVFIAREERMLQKTFSEEYEDYCCRVRRWI